MVIAEIQDKWSWAFPAAGGALVTLTVMAIGYTTKRWYEKRGSTIIRIGDREPASYIIRGKLSQEGRIVQDSPRFLNFSIPLTLENRRGITQTIRVQNVWFCEKEPIVNRGNDAGWRLPGSTLHPVGIRITNSSGQVVDPITIQPYGIEYIKIEGTATSPVCHSGAYKVLNYVFIDWYGSPGREWPLSLNMRDGRKFDPNLEPLFPLPAHYPEMQRGNDFISQHWS